MGGGRMVAPWRALFWVFQFAFWFWLIGHALFGCVIPFGPPIYTPHRKSSPNLVKKAFTPGNFRTFYSSSSHAKVWSWVWSPSFPAIQVLVLCHCFMHIVSQPLWLIDGWQILPKWRSPFADACAHAMCKVFLSGRKSIVLPQMTTTTDILILHIYIDHMQILPRLWSITFRTTGNQSEHLQHFVW